MKKPIAFIYTTFLFTSICLTSCSNSQSETSTSEPSTKEIKTAGEFFDIPKTQVLTVGVFHFDYPNLDALKTEEKDKVDVLSETRQVEMAELIQYLKKFKPTKIGIEAHNNRFTKDLKLYKEGNFELSRDERHQLGVRLAAELNLDTLYAIDAGSFSNDLSQVNPTLFQEMWEDYDWKSDDLVDSLKRNWFDYQQNLLKEISLFEYLKYMNSEESHQYGYGTYFTGDFRLGDTRGADVLSTYWYNRNLRIFRKVQEMTESEDDRILLIFGNGHAALMRQFFTYSPEYEFIEFNSL